jgi:phosphohistidine phosphatase
VKTLLLLRHAKSAWDDSSLPDHDRPLKRRGVKAARRIGQLMKNLALTPDMVISSTAVRAKDTLRLVLEAAGFAAPLKFNEQLYLCDADQFATVLRSVDDCNQAVLLVGHNPGLEEFLSKLAGKSLELPTGTLARIEVPVQSWSQFTESTTGTLIGLWRPRDLTDDNSTDASM